MRSAFRDLRAYQLASELSDELHGLVSRWPNSDRRSHGEQLMRAIDSVGANIAEASGRWQQRGLLQRGSTERLAEIARTLNGLIKKHG